MANLHEITLVFIGISDQCALHWNNAVNAGSTPYIYIYIYGYPEKAGQKVNVSEELIPLYSPSLNTVDLQWLEHLWDLQKYVRDRGSSS